MHTLAAARVIVIVDFLNVVSFLFYMKSIPLYDPTQGRLVSTSHLKASAQAGYV